MLQRNTWSFVMQLQWLPFSFLEQEETHLQDDNGPQPQNVDVIMMIIEPTIVEDERREQLNNITVNKKSLYL